MDTVEGISISMYHIPLDGGDNKDSILVGQLNIYFAIAVNPFHSATETTLHVVDTLLGHDSDRDSQVKSPGITGTRQFSYTRVFLRKLSKVAWDGLTDWDYSCPRRDGRDIQTSLRFLHLGLLVQSVVQAVIDQQPRRRVEEEEVHQAKVSYFRLI